MTRMKIRWTAKLARKAIDDFVSHNNRVPNTRELKANHGLPAPGAIERLFKKNYRLWLQKTYPEYVHESWQLDLIAKRKMGKRKWLALFRKEYVRIKPTSGSQYNKNRSEGTPTWGTIAKLAGEDKNKWTNLKRVAEVENFPIPQKETPAIELKVSVFVNVE